LGVTALLTAFAVFAVNSFLGETVVLSFATFRTEGLAALLAIPLLLVAAFVITARDARRFVVGCVVASFLAFMVVYPNISALPLPSILVNAYQGLLPTWLWPFQFPVNTDAPVATPSFFSLWPAMIGLLLTATCLVVAYVAASWR